MIIKSNVNKNYIGPKALFDPNYIPPHLLYRKKEEDSLFSILNDSLSDEFCLSILYHGIDGIGKKVIVNKVLNDLLIQNEDFNQINKICVDCKEKKFEEPVIITAHEEQLETGLDDVLIAENIKNSPNGKFLAGLGYDLDVNWAATKDKFVHVPVTVGTTLDGFAMIEDHLKTGNFEKKEPDSS